MISIVLCNSLTAQQTKKVTQNIGDPRNKVKEVYYVMDDDSIKEGPYELTRNRKVFTHGFYKQGKKDNVWESYNRNGMLLSRKRYHNGERAGIWEFFKMNGYPERSYDCNSAMIEYQQSSKIDSTKLYYQDEKGNWIHENEKRGPIALRSQAEWMTFLLFNLHYPDEAISSEQQGDVVVSITVDENGNEIDFNILRSAAPSLDAEGLRIVKGFHCEYVPAETNGRKVKAKVV
jgi:TonB family protein